MELIRGHHYATLSLPSNLISGINLYSRKTFNTGQAKGRPSTQSAATLEMAPPFPVKPSVDCSPDQHLNYNLIMDSKLESPS